MSDRQAFGKFVETVRWLKNFNRRHHRFEKTDTFLLSLSPLSDLKSKKGVGH